MSAGRLVTIEGLDGAGKSTLAHALTEELAARGVAARLIREPGGVEIAERIRMLLIDPGLPVTPRAEALLYAAARAQLVEQLIEPLLAGGALLVLDRFVDSSLAYQGAGRGLGVEQIAAINTFATGALQPDRTLLLDLPPSAGRARKRLQGQEPDRLEREGEEFFERIALAYRALAHQDPARIRLIDATLAPAAVLQSALEAISDLLGDPGPG